jgi:Raf kinase inhibitor-like YbhB/YbcL family protein
MGIWDHWVVWNIAPVEKIDENSIPKGAVQGTNSAGSSSYMGPCPPSGTHRYIFTLYTLNTFLDLP